MKNNGADGRIRTGVVLLEGQRSWATRRSQHAKKIRVQSWRIRTSPARPYLPLADCKSGLWAIGAGVRNHDTSTYPAAVLQATAESQLMHHR